MWYVFYGRKFFIYKKLFYGRKFTKKNYFFRKNDFAKLKENCKKDSANEQSLLKMNNKLHFFKKN